MGSGKSTVGAELARRWGVVFVDLDLRVARISGLTVAALFARSEVEFREHEAGALRSLVAEPGFEGGGAVVATGGGVVLDASNRALMSRLGRTCYLDADVETLVARLSHPAELARRPLLAGGDLRGELVRIKERREQYYRGADIIVDAASPVPEVVEKIVDAL